MLWKIINKKPVFFFGLTLFILFLFDMRNKGNLFTRENLIPVSCRSAIVMLENKSPKDWDISCEKNTMTVKIKSKLSSTQKEDKKNLYSELGNHLYFIANNCLNESLERTDEVKVHLLAPHLEILSATKGVHLAKLVHTKNKKDIYLFLNKHVLVKETAR